MTAFTRAFKRHVGMTPESKAAGYPTTPSESAYACLFLDELLSRTAFRTMMPALLSTRSCNVVILTVAKLE